MLPKNQIFNAPEYRPLPLVLIHLFILFLLLAYQSASFLSLLSNLDIHLAYFFNHLLVWDYYPWHLLWAALSTNAANWIYDFSLLLFLIPYILKRQGKERLEILISLMLLICLTIIISVVNNHLIVNKFLHQTLDLNRNCPSNTLPHFFDLHSAISSIPFKTSSHLCFPSGHGNTFLIVIFSSYFLFGKRAMLIAFILSLQTILPRLLVGAHWMSDIMCGSLPLILFIWGWLFYTPLFSYIIHLFMKPLEHLYEKRES